MGIDVNKNTGRGVVVTPMWEKKLREKFAFSNNPGRWKDRQTVDEVVQLVKDELNGPIQQYERQLVHITLTKLRMAFKDGHGGGNWRRLYILFEKELEYTLATMAEEEVKKTDEKF